MIGRIDISNTKTRSTYSIRNLYEHFFKNNNAPSSNAFFITSKGEINSKY